MDQASDAIVMWGLDGRISYVNAAWERLADVPRAAGGRRAGPRGDAADSRLAPAGDRRDSSPRARRGADASRCTAAASSTRRSRRCATTGRIVHFVSVMRDVTREVELEARIRRQQKLEAIGTLASGVAHDFNNLLTGVLGYAELLARSRRGTPRSRRRRLVIGEAARRGSDLTSRLLGFGLHTRLRSEPVDVHETVREVVAAPLAHAAAKHLDRERSRRTAERA